jgi:hypothetical protein
MWFDLDNLFGDIIDIIVSHNMPHVIRTDLDVSHISNGHLYPACAGDEIKNVIRGNGPNQFKRIDRKHLTIRELYLWNGIVVHMNTCHMFRRSMNEPI